MYLIDKDIYGNRTCFFSFIQERPVVQSPSSPSSVFAYSPLPRTPDSLSSTGSNLSATGSALLDLRSPLEFSLEQHASMGERKQSTTMLEIERNRSLFIEQQGQAAVLGRGH